MDDNDFAENAIEPLIVEKAKDYRQDNPGLGCAKLYLIIRRLFESTGCMPGRDAFIELLRKHGLMVQIKRRRHYKTTDSNHHYRKYDNLDPLENAIAERANGILKTEWLYKMKIPTIDKCKESMERIILFYNRERPHMSIGNKTPEVVHGEKGEQKRCWRNPWEKSPQATAPG